MRQVPQREGGGDGVLDEEVANFLMNENAAEKKKSHIMMDRICPPVREGLLVRPHHPVPVEAVECTQEIGIYGYFISNCDGEIISNKTIGHIVRSKLSESNEGEISEATNAGSDSVYLTDTEKCRNTSCKYVNEI